MITILETARLGRVSTRIVLTFLLAAALAAASCGGSDDGGERPTVVAAFYPLAYAAERIAGSGVEVRNLTPVGAEPHDLELTPRDVEELDAAEHVFYLGGGFMPALEDAVEGDERAVDLLAGQRLVRSAAHGHGEEESELDPHVWLDPLRYARIAARVGDVLGRPAAAQELVAELRRLDGEFRAGLATCERRAIVTSHAAFGYLARRYGLEQVALTGVSPEAEPGPRALRELADEVEQEGATTVFFETLVSPRLAETIAREAGASTAVLDPLEGLTQEAADRGADYFSVMRENLAALRQALGCR
jgi:zinc transport system substrate-binding protein